MNGTFSTSRKGSYLRDSMPSISQAIFFKHMSSSRQKLMFPPGQEHPVTLVSDRDPERVTTNAHPLSPSRETVVAQAMLQCVRRCKNEFELIRIHLTHFLALNHGQAILYVLFYFSKRMRSLSNHSPPVRHKKK